MQASDRCLAFIKGFEKCRLVAYMPTPNDVPTIGWGSTGPDIKLGMRWTQEQADARFNRTVAVLNDVMTKLVGPRTTQSQFDAMFSLAYNIGTGAFKASTVLREHLAGHWQAAADAFALFNKQKGVVLNGLTTRRWREANTYKEDTPK